MTVKLSDVIAPAFHKIHRALREATYTHIYLKGGRGSTKSSFAAIELVLGLVEDPQANAVVLRKVKDTLRESVMDQIDWAITTLGMEDEWDIPEAKLVITYKPTGQEIRFRGADKPKKIKSMKFSRGYCKFIWYEELDEFTSAEEVRMINQSLMRGGPTFKVIYTYNPPKSANNWVNTEVQMTRHDRIAHHSDYTTVPREWLGEQFIVEAEHLRDTKLKAYEHEYLGIVTGTGGEVFDNVQIRPISDEEIEDFYTIRRGLDFGYSIDPVSYGVMHYDRKHKRLYIYYEFYKVRCSNLETYEVMHAENKKNEVIYADSAEPKSIAEINQYGLRLAGVKKGGDSIDYGIKHLQSLETIIIDDRRCPETAREFLAYELDKDAQGNWKSGYPDKNNHTIDMVRYAVNVEAMDWRDKTKKPNINPTMDERAANQINALDKRAKSKKKGSVTFAG